MILLTFTSLAGLLTLAVTYMVHAVNSDERADERLNMPPERARID